MTARRTRRTRPGIAAWAGLGALVLLAVDPRALAAAAVLALAAVAGVLAWRRLAARPPAELVRERDALAAELERTRTRAADVAEARAEARQHRARAAELTRERDALARELTGTRAALEGAQAEARAAQGRAAELEQRANDALEAMRAAWDASTEPSSGEDARRRALLADPRSGARPLIGGTR